MKQKIISIISLLILLMMSPSVINAACISPLAGGTCPTSNPTVCDIYNENTGLTDRSCCVTPTECSTAQTPPTSAPAGPPVQFVGNYCDTAGSYAGPCKTCTNAGNAWTAIGCIDTNNLGTFVTKFVTVGTGMAGGIAFLLILMGGFQILTGGGNPEQMNAGKELVGSAITGLILIIFSVFVLRVLGVDVLGIPGFL